MNWTSAVIGAFVFVLALGSMLRKRQSYVRASSAESKPLPKWLDKSSFVTLGLFMALGLVLIYDGFVGLHILNFFRVSP